MPAFSRFLRYFESVARVGSIRKASEELHISASAIDRQILLGEEQLGARLFERLPSGLRLTTAGEIMLNATRNWTREFDGVRMLFDDLRGLRRGTVHVGIIEALAQGFVPQAIRQMKSEHPLIHARVSVLRNAEVAAAVARSEVDFGLLLNPGPFRDLSVRAHAENRLGIVSTTAHPVAQKKSTRFSVCAQYPVVAPVEPLALCEQIRALETTTGVTVTRVAESDNIQLMKSLIALDVGIGVLTWLDVVDEVRRGELAFTPISHATLRPLTLAVCVDPARELSAAAQLLLGCVETALQQFAR